MCVGQRTSKTGINLPHSEPHQSQKSKFLLSISVNTSSMLKKIFLMMICCIVYLGSSQTVYYSVWRSVRERKVMEGEASVLQQCYPKILQGQKRLLELGFERLRSSQDTDSLSYNQLQNLLKEHKVNTTRGCVNRLC